MKDDAKTKSRGHLGIAVCVVVLLPILYVLSIGPAILLFDRPREEDGAIMAAYGPVFWMRDHSPTFERAYDWYLHLWGLPCER